jgi:hypothetical protein
MLHVIAITLIALAMAPAVGHALKLPGKVRFPKEMYVTVQQIYYPGFTIAGVGEFAAFIPVALLLWSTPRGTVAFWLALGALLGVLAMQAVYGIAIHPINKFWLQGKILSALALGFSHSIPQVANRIDRGRRDLSHLVRAVLALVVLVAAVNT